MLSVLLTILKIIGIILLCILSALILILVLVLFVPLRYRITGYGKTGSDPLFRVQIKITWLFHIIRVAFKYPEAAYIKVKIFFFTAYHSSAEKKKTVKTRKKKKTSDAKKDKETSIQEPAIEEPADRIPKAEDKPSYDEEAAAEDNQKQEEKKKKSWKTPFVKIWNIIKNIWYTILEICAKIKDAVSNIRYYVEIIKSEEFKKAFLLCSKQLKRIYRNIKPSKLKANITVGTEDPATTGQILEVYSILYPLIGNNVFIFPDFEESVFEGDFFIKGRVSAYVLLWAAWKIYKDANIRKVLNMLKREEV